jgi:hypothetical protein
MMPGPARRFPFNACLVSWRCRRLVGNATPWRQPG